MNPVYIKATDFQDAWYQCLYNILEKGKRYSIDEGSFKGTDRLEFDWITIHITHPFLEEDGLPIIPTIPSWCSIPPPVDTGYVIEYIRYIMDNTRADNELYTYGERIWRDSQIKEIIDRYKTKGFRNNQMVIQVAEINDLFLQDPPCLRHIDTKIQNDRLHFFPYFRSWDLWAGMPANLPALAILQGYMADQIGVDCGEFICTSKGLHLYEYAINLAEIRCMKDEIKSNHLVFLDENL